MGPQRADRSRPKKRILIAEDDESIRTLLQRALSRKYDVTAVEDGPGVIAEAGKTPGPQLILLDVMMPGIDGFGVAERLKLFPHLARVPIVFLTAREDPQAVIRGIRTGARHYLTKPFKVSDVLGKIAHLLGE